MVVTSDRLAFVSSWHDPVSGVTKDYQLLYFPSAQEVEMFDLKTRRTFLKRCKVEGLHQENFFVGGKVTIFSRQLELKEYGDAHTRKALEQVQQRSIAVITPDAVQHMGKIVHEIYQHGFVISKLRLCQLSRPEAQALLSERRDDPGFASLVEFMASGRVLAMQIVASDAIQRWRDLMGPVDPDAARRDAPTSLRAKFGSDGIRNACLGSSSAEAAARDDAFFFGLSKAGAASPSAGTTLAIIKPHVLADKCAGMVLDELAARCDVRSMELFTVDKAAASEFFEVYNGVVAPSEFTGMVDELTSGPCLAIELGARDGGEPVEPLRQLCGPADPEVARVLRPGSLRARFGIDRSRNAVHCTDLPEDGPLEVSYFFQILQA